MDDPTTSVIAPAPPAETAAIVDTETGAAPAIATRPVTTEREHLAARPGAKPVGAEAGVVILVATHVVTEAGMGTFIEEAEVVVAPGPARLSATTAPAAKNAAITTTAAIGAVRTTAVAVGPADTAPLAMPHLPSLRKTSETVAPSSCSSSPPASAPESSRTFLKRLGRLPRPRSSRTV